MSPVDIHAAFWAQTATCKPNALDLEILDLVTHLIKMRDCVVPKINFSVNKNYAWRTTVKTHPQL